MTQSSGAVAARSRVAEALCAVAVWIGGLAGAALVLVALVISETDVLVVGINTLLVGLVGLVQRWRGRPRPLPILLLASASSAFIAPMAGREAHVVILPALTLFAFVGVLAMPRRTALWFAVWCAGIGVAMLPWLLPDVTPAELVVATIMLAAVYLAGWRFLGLAAELLVREEESHRVLFEASPVAVFEEDYTAVASRLEELRAEGVTDLASHLRRHPDLLRTLISIITIRRVNRAGLEMVGAKSVEELIDRFGSVERLDSELEPFLEQFLAMWDGRNEVATDLAGTSLEGESLEGVLHWLVPTDRGKMDLSRVIVTISDITPRKAIETRLAETLEANRRLLEFEHALTLCSRSLLLGSGDDALEEALETLRVAIGADRAYLTVNVDDPEAGPCFHVVRSASTPEFAEDEWLDKKIPWSKYEAAHDTLAVGRPFQHIATEVPGQGWNRSILTVPIFAEGRWLGSAGFADIARRTVWTAEAVRMLEVAAPMLGTFWEREMTRKRLEELVISKDRFVASVSHELRTPLAAILGFAEELRESAASFRADELTSMLELIADQSKEMADMVEDLLVSARADIGKVTIRSQDVYLRSQAEAVLAGLGTISGKGIEVVGSKGKVWADPSRTRQIIRNLITNAIRYGGDNIVVEAIEGDGETVLTVRDDGEGLDPTQWDEIFEPYQRAHDAPTQPASIGLGLTVSRQLARLMDGDLIYRCDEGGSVFALTLPSSRGDEEEGRPAEAYRLAGAITTD